ncbi:ATP synthase F0 subunit B [Armatimonadetes bacterium Uphvl-Ar1]|nr:ATP synthase F0 subunit B [Armatimonadetes bacterium Uphvl-Ar1]
MSQIEAKQGPSATSIIGMIVFGAILMVAGFWAYTNGSFKAVEGPLADQGIPLAFGKTIASFGVLLILFKVLHIFFFAPLDEAITNRTKELEHTFGEAESLRSEMTQLKSDYEKRLTETEANAREQIQAQIKEAQDLKKELMADAQRKAEEYKQQAIAEIESEKRKALTDLRVHVTNLSLQATEKLLTENVDNDRNRRIIDDFLATVEVKN